MLRILFVDDDKPLLKSLKRSLSVMKPEWTCSFFMSAREALAFLEDADVDVVISDIKMPHMDGVEFLAKVQQLYPSPIRIIFSGHMGDFESLQSIKVAHMYLAKPSKVEEIIEVVERTTKFKDVFTDMNLLSLVTKIDSLPVLPDVYLKVTTALKDPNRSMDDIGKIISQDPSMSASILKTVNSPFFGIRSNVQSVNQAVRLLGMETVRGLVLCEGVFRQFSPKVREDFSLKLLWEHSVRVSGMSRAIARHESLPNDGVELVTLAGLLHDLGKLILLDRLPREYHEVLETVRKDKINTIDAEVRAFGVGHAKLCAYLLGLWGCADELVYAIAYHHQPGKCQWVDAKLLAILHFVNTIDHDLYRLKDDSYDRVLDESFLHSAGVLEKKDEWLNICRETMEAEQ